MDFAKCLAQSTPDKCWYYFSGELGAGKTTLIRAFLREFGISGAIRSPSFTLVESYQVHDKKFYHFDCYRYESPQVLEDIGYRDYFSEQAVVLLEWPENGQGVLRDPDCHIRIEVADNNRSLSMESLTERGDEIIQQFGRIWGRSLA